MLGNARFTINFSEPKICRKSPGGDGCRWYFECQDQVLVAWPKFAVFVFVVFQNEPPGRGGSVGRGGSIHLGYLKFLVENALRVHR